MRICFVTPVFPPYRSGMSEVALRFAEWAYEAGHEVHVYRPRSRGPSLVGVPFHVHDVRSLLRYGNAALVAHIPIERAPDVIHVHAPFVGAAIALWRVVRRFPHAKIVVTYHMDLVATGAFRSAVFRLWEWLEFLFIRRCADVIHVSSRDYFNHSRLAYAVGAGDSRVREIPFSVHESHFVEPREVERDHQLVLMVAALDAAHRFKGVRQAIEAVCVLNTKGVQSKLCVVGDGPCRNEYERFAVLSGVADNVSFVGSVSDDDLKDLYRRARVCVVPSVSMSEAFGLVLVEAQAAGVPVVASDLPGVRKVFLDGVSGVRVPAGDCGALANAIERMVTMEMYAWRTWSDAARAWARRTYHPDVVRGIVVSLYT